MNPGSSHGDFFEVGDLFVRNDHGDVGLYEGGLNLRRELNRYMNVNINFILLICLNPSFFSTACFEKKTLLVEECLTQNVYDHWQFL